MMKKLNHFAVYDELPLWSAPFGLTLLEKVRIRKDISILDIGSGSGFPMLELAERFGSTCRVYGLDPSEDSVEMISEKIMLKGISNAEIIKGFAEEMPFPDKTFSLITANNGLNNVQDDLKVLQECNRVTDSGAQIVVTMNLPHTMTEFYSVFKEVMGELGMPEKEDQIDQHIFQKRKPVEYWKDKIHCAGFDIRNIEVDGFRLRYADADSFLNHYFIKTAFMGSWKNIAGDDEENIFRRITEKLNIKAKSEGQLVMSIPYVCFDCDKR